MRIMKQVILPLIVRLLTLIAASRNAVIEICIASLLGIPRGWRFEIGIGCGFGTVTGGGFAV